MHRKTVVRTDEFLKSVSRLGDSGEILLLIEHLIARIERWPELAPVVANTKGTRVLRTRSSPAFPPVRIFYRAEGERIWLLKVTIYDELWFPRGST